MTESTPPSGPPARLRPTLPAWAQVTAARLQHIQRVAELVAAWAEELGLPESEEKRWLKAVWLHDALRDAPEAELMKWASSTPGPVEMRHGPAAASRAKSEGETDRGVLDAVRYHSTGLAEWDMAGRALYCADFLDPGRSFDREARAALAKQFPSNPQAVLREVAWRRMAYLVESRWIIPEPTYRFWNALAA
ncbi:MAG: HD domain-containing protein [Gemmatimonadales bacterium]|nr:HD domain-containing protein [Gemmatimonadales bacterium]